MSVQGIMESVKLMMKVKLIQKHYLKQPVRGHIHQHISGHLQVVEIMINGNVIVCSIILNKLFKIINTCT
jgi:hypothetical protein